MAKTKEPVNPFYLLLVVLGILFFVTAVAYWQMAYRAIPATGPQAADRQQAVDPQAANDVPANTMPAGDPQTHPLLVFLDQHGMALLLGELALLGVATFGAMGLDQYRSSRRAPAAGVAGQGSVAGSRSVGTGPPILPNGSTGTAADSPPPER